MTHLQGLLQGGIGYLPGILRIQLAEKIPQVPNEAAVSRDAMSHLYHRRHPTAHARSL